MQTGDNTTQSVGPRSSLAPTAMALSTTELKEILSFTISLALRAGDLILQGSKDIITAAGQGVSEKKNAVDLVTEWDVKVEEMIKQAIASAYPSFKLLAFNFSTHWNDYSSSCG